MTWRNPLYSSRIVLSIFGVFTVCSPLIHSNIASDAAPTAEESRTAKDLTRINRGAEIDCITPDGRRVAVPSADEKHPNSSALMVDDDTLTCPLQEGETTFVISFPKASLLDRFTFINENAGVQGEMRIAVSSSRLPADSPKWTEVSGKTEFVSKRSFNLSLVGIEARYVKLSFRVEKGGHIASLGRFDGIVP